MASTKGNLQRLIPCSGVLSPPNCHISVLLCVAKEFLRYCPLLLALLAASEAKVSTSMRCCSCNMEGKTLTPSCCSCTGEGRKQPAELVQAIGLVESVWW